ncbi:hypothetical protein MPD5_0201 [Melissococcus plutonius DAT561]|uniref:Uncharacterized protein n=1 Tax=Melissococcus plutonius TaxID=33970 RepID=A0A2Z5Y0Q8_9ENTE|nr:hypothetical protein MPD5_0201 [Melissococcus plutonius DAT561]BBC60369.1 hypothetical protein DAT561_0201 [Melissococcus plutonius]
MSTNAIYPSYIRQTGNDSKINQSVLKTARCLKRSRQTIHKVYLYFKMGHTTFDYFNQYRKKANVIDIPSFYQRNKKPTFGQKLFKDEGQIWLSVVQHSLLIVLFVHFIECFRLAYFICPTRKFLSSHPLLNRKGGHKYYGSKQTFYITKTTFFKKNIH